MKCSGCSKTCAAANCMRCSVSSCEKLFCSQCINPATLILDRKKGWKCPDCSAAAKKAGGNSATPGGSTNDKNNSPMQEKEVSTDSSQDMKELIAEVKALTKEIQDLKKKLDESSSSLSRCHERLDELVSAQRNSDARLKVMEQRDEEFVLLQNRVTELEGTLNAQAQTHLRNEVEIIGIPESASENLHHTVLIAARKIGVDLTEEDVDWVQRAGPRRAVTPENNFSRPVVVRLLRRAKRDQIIKASKSRRNITSKDLGVDGPARKVFYNERLTKENRQLFREARETSSKLGYKYCWCHQGVIYMRRREGTSAFPIRTKDDLRRILPATPAPDETDGLPDEILQET